MTKGIMKSNRMQKATIKQLFISMLSMIPVCFSFLFRPTTTSPKKKKVTWSDEAPNETLATVFEFSTSESELEERRHLWEKISNGELDEEEKEMPDIQEEPVPEDKLIHGELVVEEKKEMPDIQEEPVPEEEVAFTSPKKKLTSSNEAPDGTCPPLAPRKRQIEFLYLGTVVEFPISEQEEPVREEPRRPEKPKKVKLRRSKRIAAHQKNKAKSSPPTRRSTRIAAMNKKKGASS